MENNTEPEIKIRRYGSNHEFKTSISDSFRISSDAYIFECQILDEVDYKDLAYDYTFSFGSGNFEFIKDNQLAFTPDYTGVNVFNIKVTDVYGAESFANASIFVFDNLPPVAKLSITEKENYYEFDASESFDPDKNYGGYIIQYKLTINGTQPIYRKEPIINFQGLFIDNPTVVKLAVQDNDSAWSEEINQILYP
ncbi:MAG: hypothetical protein GXX85_00810 [Ignavibacteria bacterium]|nr:hypothetical protein [Ignavibacteria bacterium]